MRKGIIELIKERKVIFDGAMGTMLMSKGLPNGKAPESWNLERPDAVKEIHRQYLEAGAMVIETNTFNANSIKSGKVEELNKEAVKLAHEVLPEGRYIAGDIGPTGKLLKPSGTFELKKACDAFYEQASVLAQEGVDLFIIETMYDLNEAIIALKVVKEVGARFATPLPVIVSLTYEATPRGFFTLMGDTPEKAATLLKENGADIIGANCTVGSREMVKLVELMRKWTDLPIIAQPNAGKPEVKGDKILYKETPEKFASNALKMFEEGASIVGGCCGTTPEFIRKLSELLSEKKC